MKQKRPKFSWKKIRQFASGLFLGLIVLSACTPFNQATPSPSPTHTAMPSPTQTPTPSLPTATPAVTIPSATPVLPSLIHSPIHEIDLYHIEEIIKNPLKLPQGTEDTGHHGVDFSFWSYQNWNTIEGLGIDSMLDGIVAGTVDNRYPYGYMIMIETPWEKLPEEIKQGLPAPQIHMPLDLSHAALTCPVIEPMATTNTSVSLYILYAHMLEKPTLPIGNAVLSGQSLGQIGNTGDSTNAHLHLEGRVGPSGLRFDQMGHYMNDSSEIERYNYCLWRISGVYQLIDPMTLIYAGKK